MTKPTKTTPPNTGELSNEALRDYTALGIIISSYKANGIHVANEDKYWELYDKELQIAFNNGRLSAISELAEG
jgi:hypothetical protein